MSPVVVPAETSDGFAVVVGASVGREGAEESELSVPPHPAASEAKATSKIR